MNNGFLTTFYKEPLGADLYSKWEQQDGQLLPPTSDDFKFSTNDANDEFKFSINSVDNQFDLSL